MRTLGATNGDLDWTIVDELESVKQRIVQRLLFWRGEWSQDTRKGVPYLPSILGRQGTLALLRQVIIAHILDVEDVTQVRNAEIEFDSSARRVRFRADIDTIYGTLEGLAVDSPALPLVA